MIENRDNIYKLAELLDFVIEVYKDGVFIGKYRYINGSILQVLLMI
jgi:hypothetical protein